MKGQRPLELESATLQVSVWSGVVIRGDLNSIRVNAFSSIGDRTVIHAARWAVRAAVSSMHAGIQINEACLQVAPAGLYCDFVVPLCAGAAPAQRRLQCPA